MKINQRIASKDGSLMGTVTHVNHSHYSVKWDNETFGQYKI
jgi:hypothetical protein